MFDENKVNYLLAEELLNDDKVDNTLVYILKEYIKRNPNKLINIISTQSILTTLALEQKDKEIQDKDKAIEDLIHSSDIRYDELDDAQYIAFMWKPIKEYFSDGTSDGASPIGKRFFEKFVSRLANSKSLIDSKWAKNIGANDYLKLVYDKNCK